MDGRAPTISKHVPQRNLSLFETNLPLRPWQELWFVTMGGYHSDGHTLNPLERSLRHSSACPTPLYSYFYDILCFYVFAYLFSNFASLSPTLISSFPCASHVSAQRRFLAPSAAHGSRPTTTLEYHFLKFHSHLRPPASVQQTTLVKFTQPQYSLHSTVIS